MTWTSRYSATFTEPLIDQLMSIVQRDQREALDFVSGEAGELPDISEYRLAPRNDRDAVNFPSLMILPSRVAFESESVGSIYSKPIELHCEITVSDPDDQKCMRLVQRYVRALHLIFANLDHDHWEFDQDRALFPFRNDAPTLSVTMSPEIVASALTPAGSIQRVFVASHEYHKIEFIRGVEFAATASLQLEIDREET